MSTVEFGRDQGHDFEESDFDRRVKQVVNRMLREPAYLPDEYKAWLKLHLEQVGLQIPISQINGSFLVEDTAAKLGGNIHGRYGMIRAGASPYDFFQLVYDGVAEVWVSSYVLACDQNEAFGTTNTSFQGVGTPYASAFIVPYGSFVDAGLKPQLRMMAFLTNDTGGGTATATMAFETYDSGDVAGSGTGASWTITSSGTNVVMKDSGWQEIPSLTKRTLLYGAFALKSSSGANTAMLAGANCWLRWMSA